MQHTFGRRDSISQKMSLIKERRDTVTTVNTVNTVVTVKKLETKTPPGDIKDKAKEFL